MTLRRLFAPITAYVILTILGLFWLVPFAWPVLASLNPTASYAVEWPHQLTLGNFGTIIGSGLVVRPFINSGILAVSTMVGCIVLSGLAAYPLSRYHFRFKQALMYFILFISALPILALVTPLYALYVALNLQNTLQGCILFFIASSLPFDIWIMKNFLDSVSVELEEAAWVDGASTLSAFFRILLPLSAPGVAVVGLLSFIGAWANFFVPLILLQNQDLFPASIHIYTFFGAYGQVNYGQLAAYAMLYALPIAALYIFFSRYLVKGVNLGGVKG